MGWFCICFLGFGFFVFCWLACFLKGGLFWFFYETTLFLKTCVFCSFRIAVAHRTMFQRGEVHNKPTGFWGMIKSVTTSVSGSESILHLYAGTCLGRWLQLSALLKGQVLVEPVTKHLCFNMFWQSEQKAQCLLGSLLSRTVLSAFLHRGWTPFYCDTVARCRLLPCPVHVLSRHHGWGVHQIAGQICTLTIES